MCYYYTAQSFYNSWIEETGNPDDSIDMHHLCELTTAVNLHGETLSELIQMLPHLNWNTKQYYTLKWKKPIPQYVINETNGYHAAGRRIRAGIIDPQDRIKPLIIPTDFNRTIIE